MSVDRFLSWICKSKKREVKKKLNKKLRAHNFFPIDEAEDKDIYIVGYPKSGNTWMQSLVAGVLYGIDTEFMPDKLVQELVPDVHYKKVYKRFSDITFFKSHHLPKENYKRVIYLSRDGRDVMTSYFHMNKIQEVSSSFKDMVIDGKGLFPSKWYEHVESWTANKYDADILYVRYEDLINDPIPELKRICDFSELSREDNLLERVINGCTFQKMRQKEEKFGFDNRKWKGDNKGKAFFRKGKTGEYKKEFPADLLEIFEQESGNALTLLNYL